MGNFKNLIAWQKAHKLVLRIYKLVKKFPAFERFILVPQIIRAAISVAANLAEGTKRLSAADQRHFFNMAETSLEEVKYYLLLANDLGYITAQEYDEAMHEAEDTGRLISGLVNKK